jgi:hypothetical protein
MLKNDKREPDKCTLLVTEHLIKEIWMNMEGTECDLVQLYSDSLSTVQGPVTNLHRLSALVHCTAMNALKGTTNLISRVFEGLRYCFSI